MKHFITIACLLICITTNGIFAQTNVNRLDSILPVRGLAIAAPSVQKMDVFLKFIEEELAPGHFNLLILRVDWNYAYESHPELRDPNPLTLQDVKRIVATCRKHNIRIAPQINLPVISHGQKQLMPCSANIRNLMKHRMLIRKTIPDGLTRTVYIAKVTALFTPMCIKLYSLWSTN